MVILILMLFWPLWLFITVLSWFNIALPYILWACLITNLLILAGLYTIRRKWKQSGKMAKAYLKTLKPFLSILLHIVKIALHCFITWEAILCIGCMVLLVIKPDLMEIFMKLIGASP